MIGVSLAQLIEALKSYVSSLNETNKEIDKLANKIGRSSRVFQDKSELLEVLDSNKKLFINVQTDLNRALDELQNEVESRHLEILDQIIERLQYERESVRQYLKELFEIPDRVNRSKSSTALEIIDEIRDVLYEQLDSTRGGLARLKKRLVTFVGTQVPEKHNHKNIRKYKLFPKIPVPHDTKWEDIRLEFIGREDLQVCINFRPIAVKSFSETGFADKRTITKNYPKGKPNRLWQTLALFAVRNGELEWGGHETVPEEDVGRLIRNISDLRGHLKALFGIESTPISEYGKKGIKEYKAKFAIERIDKDLFQEIADLTKNPKNYSTEHTLRNKDERS